MKKMICLLLLAAAGYAQAQPYNVHLVPDSLTTGANAVKRFEEIHVVIKGKDRAVVTHKYAVTILNEAGDHAAEYYNFYDRFHSLSDISGHLYDANGKELKSVKKKDIADRSYDDNMSLATDDRYKSHNFYYRQYPYTVEYEDEVSYDGIFSLPSWDPVRNENYAVQQSRFIVETPSDYVLRYKQIKYPGAPKISDNQKVKTYTWETANLTPVKAEPYSPDAQELTTAVLIAPTDFAIDHFEGRMDSWLSMGQFLNQLYAGRDVLPDNTKQTVHRLTDGVNDRYEKIRLLYEYMQQNTRYISIQLGIGGWQPFDAKYVAANRYGDCKALSNYMKSLLKEAGIAANCVVIKAGSDVSRGLWEDFPVNAFNHVIVCVPGTKDSTWLECTSQTIPAGFLGSHTAGRQALLLAGDGGHVVWTPTYTAQDNAQLRAIHATIDADGNLTAEVNTRFSGMQEEEAHHLLHDASQQERERFLNSTLHLPTYKVEKSDYQEQKQAIPYVNESLRITSTAYATVSGKRLFIEPNLFNKANRLPSTDQPRKFDIEYNYAYRDVDSISIKIPEGYKPESMPRDVGISNAFGRYSLSFAVSGNEITVLRSHERPAAHFPASVYPELVKFYSDMYAADRKKIVFVKE